MSKIASEQDTLLRKSLASPHLGEISCHSRGDHSHHVGGAVGDPEQSAGKVGRHVKVDTPGRFIKNDYIQDQSKKLRLT